MRFLDQLKAVPTGQKYPVFDRLRPLIREDIRQVAGDYLNGEVYELSATLGVRFKAIDRHLEDAIRQAKKQILQEMHAETLQGLDKIRAALYAGSFEEALAAVDAIEKEIGL